MLCNDMESANLNNSTSVGNSHQQQRLTRCWFFKHMLRQTMDNFLKTRTIYTRNQTFKIL